MTLRPAACRWYWPSARNESDVGPRSRGEATAGEGTSPRLTYRPELDGIRGLAILLVLLGHTTELHGTGWTGVAIFFVLSGYLITGVLRRDGSLVRFYVHRIARLAPALVVTLAIVWLFLPHNGIETTLLYVSNWGIVAGYDPVALWHTWSLAIEEQFYLLWPFLLPLVFRWPRALIVVGVLDAAARFVMPVTWAYYSTCTRIDGLLIGSALALLVIRPRASWPGLAVVAICALTNPEAVPALSLAAMTLAGVLLVTSPPRILVPLAPIGRISYSLYLYHLPLIFLFGPISGACFAGIAAYLSTKFLEEPIRRAVRSRTAGDLDLPDEGGHVVADAAGASADGRRARSGVGAH